MIIAKAAEAIVERHNEIVRKTRISKSYRNQFIDLRLRKQRTRREAKVLQKINIPAPKLISSDDKEMTIDMTYLPGQILADVLEKLDHKTIGREIGKRIRELHETGIIHGDLTTSNMIYKDKLYLFDFGLAVFSDKVEDKAVDLHLLRQALESRHHTVWVECFKHVLKGYNDINIAKYLQKVESRGRNKNK